MITALVSIVLLGGSAPPSAALQAPASLIVVRRSIDPSLSIVERLWTFGEYERIETTPMLGSLHRVLRGRLDHATRLLSGLEQGGFFAWADTSLLPPSGLDVDSDPIRVSLTHGTRARSLYTREPMIPDVLRGVLATLDSTASAAALAAPCMICECAKARGKPPQLPEWSPSKEHPWPEGFRKGLEAHVAFALPAETARTLALRPDPVLVRLPDGACILRCLRWQRSMQK